MIPRFDREWWIMKCDDDWNGSWPKSAKTTSAFPITFTYFMGKIRRNPSKDMRLYCHCIRSEFWRHTPLSRFFGWNLRPTRKSKNLPFCIVSANVVFRKSYFAFQLAAAHKCDILVIVMCLKFAQRASIQVFGSHC